MKIIFFILKIIINIEFFCKRNIWESYRMYGRNKPSHRSMLVCPSISHNCCLKHDEKLIYKIFHYKIKHNTDLYFDKIFYYLKITGKYLADFNFSKLEKNIKSLTLDEIEKKGILTMYNNLIERSIFEYFKKMYRAAPKALKFWKESRKGFYCSICEFNNHKFIDIDKKEIFFSDKFCRNILDNVLEYSFYLYGIIIPFIADLVKFYSVLGSVHNKNILNSIDFYLRNSKTSSQVINCINEQKKEKFIRSCSLFCENFKINSKSKELEGDLELLMSFIQEAKQFEGIIVPNNKYLALFNQFIRYRKLESSIHNKNENNVNNFYGSNLYFDISQQENELEIQPKIYKKKLNGFEDIIDQEDEILNTENLFKTVSDNLIDLNNFSSRFDGTGINYMKYFSEANFNVTYKEVQHFKGKKYLNFDNEIANKDILTRINSLSNLDLKNFHRDTKLHFKKLKISNLDIIGGSYVSLEKERKVIRLAKKIRARRKEKARKRQHIKNLNKRINDEDEEKDNSKKDYNYYNDN